MKESDINTIIVNSFGENDKYFSYKIPDPPKSVARIATERPFDGFTVRSKPIYFETKLLKGYQAFSFSLIKDHQLRNLDIIKRTNNEVESIIILAVWESRKYLDIYMFDILFILNRIRLGDKSVLKKELLSLEDKYSIKVKNKLFDAEEALSKIIR